MLIGLFIAVNKNILWILV